MMQKQKIKLSTLPGVAMVAAVLFLFSGCDVTDSNNPDEFVVPFEIRVGWQSLGDGLYTVTGGVVAATWDRQEGVNSYTFVVVDSNGSKGEPFTRTHRQLSVVEDRVSMVLVVQDPTLYLGVNEQTKDALIEKYKREYAHYLNRWNKLEVTVNR